MLGLTGTVTHPFSRPSDKRTPAKHKQWTDRIALFCSKKFNQHTFVANDCILSMAFSRQLASFNLEPSADLRCVPISGSLSPRNRAAMGPYPVPIRSLLLNLAYPHTPVRVIGYLSSDSSHPFIISDSSSVINTSASYIRSHSHVAPHEFGLIFRFLLFSFLSFSPSIDLCLSISVLSAELYSTPSLLRSPH